MDRMTDSALCALLAPTRRADGDHATAAERGPEERGRIVCATTSASAARYGRG